MFSSYSFSSFFNIKFDNLKNNKKWEYLKYQLLSVIILEYTQKGNKKTSEKTCRSPKKLLY